MQQQQQHLMHPTMATYYNNNNNNFTTDHIQQYLDENKALILRIVEGQNTGKINECAENQARLQRNLMYLAAIADAQPHPSTAMHSQAAYYAQSQATSPQAFMASRSSMLYNQQTLNPQVGMSSIGSSGFSILQGEADTSAGLSGFGLADGCVDGSTGLHLKSRVDEK